MPDGSFAITLAGGEGSIEVKTLQPEVYLLTFNAPPDNRMSISFCDGMLLALDIIERRFEKGVLITTSAIPKFYSNGLNLNQAVSTPGFMPNKLYRLFARFLTYPMPTIALVNGHAFAGGIMMAMFHDYRVMNPSKGFVCINELEFGVALKPGMSSIFRAKLVPQVYKHLVLEAKRFNGQAALDNGLVDLLGGMDEVIKLISERKLTEKGKTNIYHLMKAEMYREPLHDLLNYDNAEETIKADLTKSEQEDQEMEQRVKQWETKSKL